MTCSYDYEYILFCNVILVSLNSLILLSTNINYSFIAIVSKWFPILFRISPLCIAREVVRNNGLRGLYRGLPGIWTKDVPGSFIYFGSYEAAKSCVRIMHGMKPDETKIGELSTIFQRQIYKNSYYLRNCIWRIC